MISDIPKATQKLSDILTERYTYDDLKTHDKISKEKRSLKSLIKEMEDEVLASAGVDSFEEIFKLIFTKLYDELICANDKTAYLQFRNNGDTDFELKEKIQSLFYLLPTSPFVFLLYKISNCLIIILMLLTMLLNI